MGTTFERKVSKCTASESFVGNVTGDITGNVAGNVTGNIIATEASPAEHGAGVIGTGVAPSTMRRQENSIIITEIAIDLTGLACKGDAAGDAIGLSAGGVAFIGRNVVANNGIVYKAEILCIEAPGEGTATITADIDLASNSSGTIEYDGAVASGGAVVINTATLVAGEVVTNDVPALTANDYLYLVEGDTAATTGVYDAGQYIVRLYGRALLT